MALLRFSGDFICGGSFLARREKAGEELSSPQTFQPGNSRDPLPPQAIKRKHPKKNAHVFTSVKPPV